MHDDNSAREGGQAVDPHQHNGRGLPEGLLGGRWEDRNPPGAPQ